MAVVERRILDALPFTIYAVDLEGRITHVNRSWGLFACDNGAPALADEDAVRGVSVWDALPDRGAREQVENAMDAIVAGRAAHVRWEFPCSSPEEERVFLMQISGLGDDGRITGFVFSTVDITPSHQSREALIDTGIALSRTLDLERVFLEVGQQARRATRAHAFALALADADSARLRIAFRAGFGGTDDEVEASLVSVWLDALAHDRPTVRQDGDRTIIVAPMTSAEGVVGTMTVAMAREGQPHRLEAAERVLDTLAAQTAAAIERAWLVRRVEHKRRLEAIGEVAAGVAHELRNPLFGISSAAQLLRFRTGEDPLVEKNVGRILREVERLNRMVGSLLEYGRPQAPVLVPHDPDQVWDDVLEGLRGRLESKGLSLARTRATPSATCKLDPEQFAQVLSNIFGNACDAAPEGSTLTLVSAPHGNGGWRCRLHNGGPAIPEDVLARVFELFFSSKTGGTGIGLALCQRIMDEHHGDIAIESAPEAGTTLTVTLPGAA
ncbi:MAG: PAS domain-containing protein [Gemmatimonadetes bacterium]|nr:PAS domain-containing protein [Gemmatimonadota bacterium]